MCQALSKGTGVYMRYVGWILWNWKYKEICWANVKGSQKHTGKKPSDYKFKSDA